MSALLALLLAAAPAAAQAEPASCYASDTPACRLQQAARQARVYGLPSIERLARDGVTVRRAFFSNQNGHDVGAVIFSRRRGERPRLTVVRPSRGAADAALSVPIPEAAWRRALAASRGFEGPEQPLTVDGEQTICFDAWAVRVEAADPPRAPRRAASATCPGGPAVDYADGLAAQALTLLPNCALLKARYFGSDMTRLSFCTALSGDRIVAAHAANAAFALAMLSPRDDAGEYPARFAAQADLDWTGEHVAGRAAVSARLLRAFGERERLFFQPLSFVGHADGSAEARGNFSEYVEDDENERLGYRVDAAPAILHMRRERDGAFRIVHIRVEPFARHVIGHPHH